MLESLGDVSWVKSPLGEGVFYLAVFFRCVRKYTQIIAHGALIYRYHSAQPMLTLQHWLRVAPARVHQAIFFEGVVPYEDTPEFYNNFTNCYYINVQVANPREDPYLIFINVRGEVIRGANYLF